MLNERLNVPSITAEELATQKEAEADWKGTQLKSIIAEEHLPMTRETSDVKDTAKLLVDPELAKHPLVLRPFPVTTRESARSCDSCCSGSFVRAS